MKKNIVYILFVTLIFGCAKKKDDSDNSGTSQTDLYKAAASTASDEAVDSIVESGSTSNFSPLTNTLAVTRACTASAGSASVLITFTGANNFTFSKTILGASVDVSVDVAKSGTETRVWNPASCHSSGEYADISWLNTGVGNNLTLNIDLNRTINRTKTFTVTKNSKTTTKTATDNVVITGNRSISWATPTLSNNQVTRVKTISSQVTRERTFTRVTGATTSLTSTVTTDSANPLVVSVVRSNVLQTLLSKTINKSVLKWSILSGVLKVSMILPNLLLSVPLRVQRLI